MNDENNKVAITQHVQRLGELADALKVVETPTACNGFAFLMKDSMILLLEGEQIRMEIEDEKRKQFEQEKELLKKQVEKSQWNWSKAAAVIAGILITNATLLISILQIVKAVAG